MTLEERYNQAPASTYVGKVRSMQAADVGGDKAGVNFMDGDGKGNWRSGGTPAPDQVQDEFKRNAEGAFRYGGDGKVAGSYTLSRWLQKGLDKGDTYLVNTRFTTISDVRNASNLVHKYSGLTGKNFQTTAGLSEMAKTNISGAPSGRAPSGLNG